MNQEEALQVIKQIIDSALKSGLFQNLESSVRAAIAYETVSKALVSQGQAKQALVSEPVKE